MVEALSWWNQSNSMDSSQRLPLMEVLKTRTSFLRIPTSLPLMEDLLSSLPSRSTCNHSILHHQCMMLSSDSTSQTKEILMRTSVPIALELPPTSLMVRKNVDVGSRLKLVSKEANYSTRCVTCFVPNVQNKHWKSSVVMIKANSPMARQGLTSMMVLNGIGLQIDAM